MFNWFFQRKNNEQIKHISQLLNEKQDLTTQVSRLLWSIAHQKEKVPGILTNLLPILMPHYTDEQLFKIKEEIIKSLK